MPRTETFVIREKGDEENLVINSTKVTMFHIFRADTRRMEGIIEVRPRNMLTVSFVWIGQNDILNLSDVISQ